MISANDYQLATPVDWKKGDRVIASPGELDRDRRVVLLCRSGGRSTQAAEFLTASGFADVVDLAGGMLAVG